MIIIRQKNLKEGRDNINVIIDIEKALGDFKGITRVSKEAKVPFWSGNKE